MTALALPSREPGRIHGFDGIRGIGMMGVVMIHALQKLWQSGTVATWQGVQLSTADERLYTTVRFAWTAVDLFFVLSGYLITGILLRAREDPHYYRNFYVRRVLRIFPLFYAIVLFRLYVVPYGAYTGLEQFAHLAYWSNFWYAAAPTSSLYDPVLGVTWSLSVEEHFYLLWPLLVRAVSRRWLLRICIGLVVAAFALRCALVLSGLGGWLVWLATPCRVDTMAIGAILAVVGVERVRTLRWWLGGSVAAIAFILWREDSTAFGVLMQTVGYSATAIFGGCLVVLSLRGGGAARFLSTPVLRSYGTHSYAIYLSHELVIEWLAGQVVDGRSGWSVRGLAEAAGMYMPAALVFLAISLVCSYGVGVILWHLIENPFLRLRRFFEVRPKAAPA